MPPTSPPPPSAQQPFPLRKPLARAAGPEPTPQDVAWARQTFDLDATGAYADCGNDMPGKHQGLPDCEMPRASWVTMSKTP